MTPTIKKFKNQQANRENKISLSLMFKWHKNLVGNLLRNVEA
jgi:hypothetical protein